MLISREPLRAWKALGLDVLAREAQLKHEHSLRPVTEFETELAVGGNYHQRVDGEYHLLNPLTIGKLQQAVRQESFQTFQEYTELVDKQSSQLMHAARLDEAEEERQAGSD